MHSTLFILFTTAVLLHVVNGQRAIPHMLPKNIQLSKIYKRQTDEEIAQCVQDRINSALEGSSSAIATACRRFVVDQESGNTTLDDFRTFCNPDCGNVFLDAGDECKAFEQEGGSAARDFTVGLCGTNSNGTMCYKTLSTNIDISDCIAAFLADSSVCNCRSELLQLNAEYGCCLDVIYQFVENIGIFNQSRALYSVCDVPYPTSCNNSPLSGVVPQVALVTLISALIISVVLG